MQYHAVLDRVITALDCIMSQGVKRLCIESYFIAFIVLGYIQLGGGRQ